jgi:hypothetical protein
MPKLSDSLDTLLLLCLFVSLGAFLLRAVVVQFWYPLVTPWLAMAWVGACVGGVFAVWARGAGVYAVLMGVSGFVAASLVSMPVFYAVNGMFDTSVPMPRTVYVVRAATRASTVRVVLPSGDVEVLLPVAIGQVQNGDTFMLNVGDGALGWPWCKLDEVYGLREGGRSGQMGGTIDQGAGGR